MTDYVARLQSVIKRLHGCDAAHNRTARVREVFQGKIVWSGKVEIFTIKGHRAADRCYAWSYRDDNGTEQYTAVLALPPVNSPEKAVRTAITPR